MSYILYQSKPANVTVATIFDKMESAGLDLASAIQQKLASGQPLNRTETRVFHNTLGKCEANGSRFSAARKTYIYPKDFAMLVVCFYYSYSE